MYNMPPLQKRKDVVITNCEDESRPAYGEFLAGNDSHALESRILWAMEVWEVEIHTLVLMV
jgi:hypothetical protein